MKKILFLGLLLPFFSLETYACNTSLTENPNFTLINLGNFKANANDRKITATTTPNRYGTIINNCSGRGNTTFQITSAASLSTSDNFSLVGRTYYRINSMQSPVAVSPAQIYIAFSVKDNQESVTKYDVKNTDVYTIYSGDSGTRGMRLEDVSIVIRGTNLTPGTYSINNIVLGTYTATGNGVSASKPITISNLSYTISSSTCVVNNPNIILPSMRSSDFSSVNQIGGATNFSITATCPDDAVSTSYSATITDNFSSARNTNGILTNSISASSGGSNIKIRLTDSLNTPIPIGPLSLENKFTLGLLDNSKKVTKNLKASYYADIFPVTVGLVNSTSILNLIYD